MANLILILVYTLQLLCASLTTESEYTYCNRLSWHCWSMADHVHELLLNGALEANSYYW